MSRFYQWLAFSRNKPSFAKKPKVKSVEISQEGEIFKNKFSKKSVLWHLYSQNFVQNQSFLKCVLLFIAFSHQQEKSLKYYWLEISIPTNCIICISWSNKSFSNSNINTNMSLILHNNRYIHVLSSIVHHYSFTSLYTHKNPHYFQIPKMKLLTIRVTHYKLLASHVEKIQFLKLVIWLNLLLEVYTIPFKNYKHLSDSYSIYLI